jgi:hypothetical protein
MQKLDEISVTDAIIGRKELDVAENVNKNYFRKASGSNRTKARFCIEVASIYSVIHVGNTIKTIQ